MTLNAALFFKGPICDEIEKRAIRMLWQLHSWAEINRLRITISKTKYMLFRAKSVKAGRAIEIVKSFKILGVIFSDNLSWN